MRCEICGYTDLSEDMKKIDGVIMCYSCKQDYRRDHPSMEEEIARAEYQSDR